MSSASCDGMQSCSISGMAGSVISSNMVSIRIDGNLQSVEGL
jgi:hypothetical protein